MYSVVDVVRVPVQQSKAKYVAYNLLVVVVVVVVNHCFTSLFGTNGLLSDIVI